MTTLIISILVLGIGPLLHRLFRQRQRMLSLLDGFNFVAISGLIFLGVLPESMATGGPWILPFALAGILFPAFMERYFKRAGRESHLVALVLGMVFLCVHSIIDGAALVENVSASAAHEHAEHSHVGHEAHLPFAIILHRVPVGLTIWLLLRPRYGLIVASGVLSVVALNTIGGFYLGEHILAQLPPQATACFQALVAGSLMHVVFHRPHESESCRCEPVGAPETNWSEGFGGAVGLILLAVLLGGSALLVSTEIGSRTASIFLELALESAPALLLGYILAGLLHSFLPAASISWMRRGSSLTQSIRGMAVGLPLPVCSCGVVPLYRTLIQRGAPATAAMAFMVATPELGIDAVLLSIPLLGVEMTVIRVVGAVIVALLVGWIVGGLTMRRLPAGAAENQNHSPDESRPLLARLRGALNFGLGELVDHTAPWILLGLCIAAIIEPLLDASWMGQLPPVIMVILFAILGVPTYVCASGATPLVAILLIKGVSPGAALAFLLTGPATNITTFGVLGRLHGRRTALTFSAAILLLSVGLGLLVDWFIPGVVSPAEGDTAGHESSILERGALIMLALACLVSFLKRGPRKFVGEIFLTGAEKPVEVRCDTDFEQPGNDHHAHED